MNDCEYTASVWGALWYSKNKLDGVREHLLRENWVPVLFDTREEAQKWIEERYGYIKDRPALQREPFGWSMPYPVRVDVRSRM